MNEFLKFFDEKAHQFPMHLSITYNKICDWEIYVSKRGCASDYPKSEKYGEDAVIVFVQDGDLELCFAKAQVQLKEWLCEFEGGY